MLPDDHPRAAPVLGYAVPPDAADPPRWLLPTARACGTVPLIVGVAATGLFAWTRAEVFASLGLMTLLFGLACSAAGMACLTAIEWLARRLPPDRRRPLQRKVFGAGVLLIANYPAALICAAVGWNYVTNETTQPLQVVVTNRGSTPATSVTIDLGDRALHFGRIGPGQSRSRTVSIGDGGVVSAHVARGAAAPVCTAWEHIDTDDVYGGATLAVDVADDGRSEFGVARW